MFKKFSNNVRALSRMNNMTISEIEKEMGVTAGYFAKSRIQRTKDVQASKLVKVSEMFGVTVDDLLFTDFRKTEKLMKIEELKQEIERLTREDDDEKNNKDFN